MGHRYAGAMSSAAPSRHRFTVEEYHRLGDAGLFANERVELIDGEIIDMAPIGGPHASTVNRLTRVLVTRLGERAVVAPQNPVGLTDLSEPQPDIAVLRPRDDFYRTHATPADVFVLIEVAETSLRFDRGVKAPLYGRAGVPETWVIDVLGRTIEVFTEPGPTGYAARRVAGVNDVLEVAAVPVPVVDLIG